MVLGKEVANTGWRVKLYELESSGTWTDLGVGYVLVQLVTELDGPALCVISEQERDKYLMVSKISYEDLYEKQGGWLNFLSFFFYIHNQIKLLRCRDDYSMERTQSAS